MIFLKNKTSFFFFIKIANIFHNFLVLNGPPPVIFRIPSLKMTEEETRRDVSALWASYDIRECDESLFRFDRFYPLPTVNASLVLWLYEDRVGSSAGLDNGKCLNFQMFTHKGMSMHYVLCSCSSHSLRQGWFYRVAYSGGTGTRNSIFGYTESAKNGSKAN